ncbi:MAG: peptide chain release factor N(5)-glutamine methyltransferase [Bacteroidaceae bacterium]|nr:peptide chain release factor N(5)-glutamine methyltransferase [Bacteroidaceae bacterium]
MKTYRQIVHDLQLVYPENEARSLARWLCEERFGLNQTDILLDKDNQLSADDIKVVREITSRLINHEPIQYILGETVFCGHRFTAAPGALIPRPETQELVAHVLRRVQESPARSILDVGTGSGCIALSLALALPEAEVVGWDVSPDALAIARHNAERYPEAHVRLEQADIFNPPQDDRQWDLIVSNPPYVCESEARQMERNVLQYEPHLALFVPDDNPLRYYRAILWYAMSHLVPEGSIFFEINQALGAEMCHLIEYFGFRDIEIMQDDFGRNRFAKCRRPS